MKNNNPSPINYKDNELQFENFSMDSIVEKFPTPFYLYSERIFLENVSRFKKAANDFFPNHSLICYALKANSNKYLIKLLSKQAIGADIVSIGELKRASQCGVELDKIVYSGVGKTKSEIMFALNQDKHIYSFNVESSEELELINHCAKELKTTARLSFRLNPQIKAQTHGNISTGDIKHKFGIIEEDIISLITNNHEKYWSHCKLIGISTHIGSQLLHLEETYNAIAVLSKLALKIENFTNAPLEMVDVGGGLGIPYTEDEEYISPSVYDYIKNLSQILKDNYLNHRQYNSPPKIVFEPGRILVGRAGVFVASVIRKKTSGKKTFVVVDGGMNDFMRPSLYQAYHRIFSKYFKVHAMENVDVVGPVCETSDQFATECLLPKSIKSGDFIVISDTGAYGYTMASNYNLRGRPAEIIVDNDNNLNIINPAEIWEELR